MTGFFSLTVRPRLQALAVLANVVFLGGIIGFPNTMRFDTWQGRTLASTLVWGTAAGTNVNMPAGAGDLTIAARGNWIANAAGGSVMLQRNGASQWANDANNQWSAQAAAAATIQGANNQDLILKAQGTAVNAVSIATGDGSANATRASFNANGITISQTTGALNGPAANLNIQAGGTNNAVVLKPTNGSGIDSTNVLSVQAAGGSWTTSGTTLIDLTGGALNLPAGTKIGGGTAVVMLHQGIIIMSGGTGTATVGSGENCLCTDLTAVAACKTSVTTTTLTVTGTGTDAIRYLCTK